MKILDIPKIDDTRAGLGSNRLKDVNKSGVKQKRIWDFGIMWIPSTPMIPDGFWHFPGAMRVISGPQECSEDIQSESTCD